MIKILIIVPYKELYESVEDYVRSNDLSSYEVVVDHLVGSEANVIKHCDAEIVVSRGMTAKAIARANPHVHLVEISISISDLIEALLKCRGLDNGSGVGVVLTNPDICHPALLQDLLGFPIYLRKAEDETELYAAISELYDAGVRTFIGGLTLCGRCEDLELKHFHIKSGKGAAIQALSEALAAAKSLSRERSRTNLIATVLNNAQDAMLAADNSGIVFASNAQASALFLKDRSKSLEGARIAELLPEFEGGQVGAFGDQGVLKTVGDQLVLLKKTPLKVSGELSGLLVTCQNVEALREAERSIRQALSKKGLVAHYNFCDIIFKSQAMRTAIADAFKYSQVESSVFIVGETGTGKELFAQSIHNASKRASHPFVAVNCAALPEQLLESELFGYTEGSFSGAAKGGRMGLFELAHKGTIFLDEIGEMPLSLQAKILRVLEEKEVRRIGGDTVVPVDVRVISATNIDMREEVRKGQFRKDLYYRINLLNLQIPPLRDRPDDVELLFSHFLMRFAAKNNTSAPCVEPEAVSALTSYPWQGNVRELRNLCERLVILGGNNGISASTVYTALGIPGEPAVGTAEAQRCEDMASYSRLFAASGKSAEEFAASLGISRTTLWRRMRQERQERQKVRN
ncbi:MAG: transcriptional regulator containing PAS AAA-type ATPase and DNA-binding domain [Spirochaetes bacterium]|nr:MAG: transcriptional regulator containing PAS AAA-type ATPase and DNA-binding domain [Spirochaetota bacterium]